MKLENMRVLGSVFFFLMLAITFMFMSKPSLAHYGQSDGAGAEFIFQMYVSDDSTDPCEVARKECSDRSREKPCKDEPADPYVDYIPCHECMAACSAVREYCDDLNKDEKDEMYPSDHCGMKE